MAYKFKVGDRIVLLDDLGSTDFCAKRGARAIVGDPAYHDKYGHGISYLKVLWDRGCTLVNKQCDGGYLDDIFALESSPAENSSRIDYAAITRAIVGR